MNKKSLKIYITIVLLFLIGFGVNYLRKNFDFNNDIDVGQKIDSLNGVYVYYNGKTGNSVGRNRTEDGYNLGLKISMCRICETLLLSKLSAQND